MEEEEHLVDQEEEVAEEVRLESRRRFSLVQNRIRVRWKRGSRTNLVHLEREAEVVEEGL